MIEIIWHGRGGQGAFTAARLLGAAYALKGAGHYALAFPSFGPERRGAPIRAFTKLDDRPIGNRSEIERADFSIFLDDTLFTESAFSELKEGGLILINTRQIIHEAQILSVDGGRIAAEILGLPIVNTIMLGALTAVYEGLTLHELEAAIRRNMPEKLHEKNILAVRTAAKEAGG